jgi:putative ABC transport system permease protein
MFRWLPLVWANMRRRKLRLILTFASILIAFMLFGLLEALRTSMVEGVNLAGADRLSLRNKAGLTSQMPLAYYEKIKAVEGVRDVAAQNWFGAEFRTPQNPKQPFAMFATQPESLLNVMPEIAGSLKTDEARAWVQDRQALIVGAQVAKTFGWKKGDRVPIRSQFLTKTDGSGTWDFNVVAVFESGSPWIDGAAYMNYSYYNESLNPYMKDQMGSASIRVADPKQGPAIARKIDAMFANSQAETQTATEREVAKQWQDQIGDMTIIVTSVTLAVFFTMLLVTANRMAQSVRERTNEIGVMKTLGFSATLIVMLVLLESLLMTVSAGLLGIGLAYGASVAFAPVLKGSFPGFELTSSSVLIAVGLMVAFGLVAGLWPSLMAMRLKVVDALRRA